MLPMICVKGWQQQSVSTTISWDAIPTDGDGGTHYLQTLHTAYIKHLQALTTCGIHLQLKLQDAAGFSCCYIFYCW